MRKQLYMTILFVIFICAITIGITYAFYDTYISDDESVSGEAERGLRTTLTLEKYTTYTNNEYNAKLLVPLKDELIGTAISKTNDKCIDKSGYKVCTLYKITLNNNSSSEDLYGYIKTTESNYQVNTNTNSINLRYQLFSSNYEPISDIMIPSNEENGIVHIKYNDTNYPIISSGTTTYYLVLWLTDINTEQSYDYSRTFNGLIGFESVKHYGTGLDRIEAKFVA